MPVSDQISEFLQDNPNGILWISVGFVSPYGLKWLAERVPRDREIRIAVGRIGPDHFRRYDEEAALDAQRALNRDNLHVCHYWGLHSKDWVVERDDGPPAALVGSANLTFTGLVVADETVITASPEDALRLLKKAHKRWQDAQWKWTEWWGKDAKPVLLEYLRDQIKEGCDRPAPDPHGPEAGEEAANHLHIPGNTNQPDLAHGPEAAQEAAASAAQEAAAAAAAAREAVAAARETASAAAREAVSVALEAAASAASAAQEAAAVVSSAAREAAATAAQEAEAVAREAVAAAEEAVSAAREAARRRSAYRKGVAIVAILAILGVGGWFLARSLMRPDSWLGLVVEAEERAPRPLPDKPSWTPEVNDALRWRRDGCKAAYYAASPVDCRGDVHRDHFVPRAEAFDSGLDEQDADPFVLDDLNLWVMSAGENFVKGDHDPAQWKPANRCVWRRYALDWIAVKLKYGLTIDRSEQAALAEMLDEPEIGCDNSAQQPAGPLPLYDLESLKSKPCGAWTSADRALAATAPAGFDWGYRDDDGDGKPCEPPPLDRS